MPQRHAACVCGCLCACVRACVRIRACLLFRTRVCVACLFRVQKCLRVSRQSIMTANKFCMHTCVFVDRVEFFTTLLCSDTSQTAEGIVYCRHSWPSDHPWIWAGFARQHPAQTAAHPARLWTARAHPNPQNDHPTFVYVHSMAKHGWKCVYAATNQLSKKKIDGGSGTNEWRVRPGAAANIQFGALKIKSVRTKNERMEK